MMPTSENILPALTCGAWAGSRGDQFLAASPCAENNDDFARGKPVRAHNDARLVVKNDHRLNPRDYRRVKVAIDVEAGRNVCGTCRRDTTAPINIAPAIRPRMHRTPVAPRIRHILYEGP